MDIPSSTAYPVLPGASPDTRIARPLPATQTQRANSSPEKQADNRRAEWVSRVIEAQASRVVSYAEDAIELKPVTIESRSPAHIQRFLDVAANGRKPGGIIDIYA